MSLAAILLAGGSAQRLGMPKGLVPIGGRPLIELQRERLFDAGVSRVVVSAGPNREAYERWTDLTLVNDPRSLHGPFGSLVAAIETLLPHTWDRVLVLPMDIPCAPAPTINRLLQVSAEAVIPRFNTQGGHPVLLSRKLAERLLTRDPQTARLDNLLHTLHPGDRIDVPVDDPTVLVDLNTMAAVRDFEATLGV